MGRQQSQRKRPKLSGTPIERELWARAGGRCEFRGCNKLLYKDDVTQDRVNLAWISHIIAFSPEGPRGHPVLSIKLEKDISNLLLTCRDHGRVIDDKKMEEKYKIELLREFKREHEERIRKLTSIQEDMKTHVLVFTAPITGNHVVIDESQIFQALLPRYPASEKGIQIDLTEIGIHEDDPLYWLAMKQGLTNRIKEVLRPGIGHHRIKSLSVFALAPIPLLVHLGTLVGDIQTVYLYQRHRSSQKWTWKKEDEGADSFYEIIEPPTWSDEKKVALVLSASGKVDPKNVAVVMESEYVTYEIQAKEPGLDFLRSEKRLELFGYEYRKILGDIRTRHGQDCEIHLFGAIPSPVAIECGRSLLSKADPVVYVYDYQKKLGGYRFALLVNTKRAGDDD